MQQSVVLDVSDDNITSEDSMKEVMYTMTDEYGNPIYGYPVD